MDIIKTIRTEIERLIEESDFDESANLYSLLSFLDTLQEPENPIYELNQYLINWVRDGQTDAEKDARWEAYRRFFELHDEAMMQEPEIDFEQELYNRFGMVKDFTLGMRIAQCFYNLGLQNAK